MSGLINERAVRLLYLGSAIRVDERQFPELHRALNDAASILDAAVVPELYVQADPFFNAMTIGLDRPIIVVNSAWSTSSTRRSCGGSSPTSSVTRSAAMPSTGRSCSRLLQHERRPDRGPARRARAADDHRRA